MPHLYLAIRFPAQTLLPGFFQWTHIDVLDAGAIALSSLSRADACPRPICRPITVGLFPLLRQALLHARKHPRSQAFHLHAGYDQKPAVVDHESMISPPR